MGISIAAGFLGLGLAFWFYILRPDIPPKLAKQFSSIYKILWNKYYVDEFYSFLIIRPAIWTAKNLLMAITDAKIIEAVVNGVPNAIGVFSQGLRRVQTGVVQHYATIMAMGVLLIAALMLLR